ncbi:MAG: asparaginase [Giesbergeria sp.]|nr:asparaginase [Giesbergeria sp.]
MDTKKWVLLGTGGTIAGTAAVAGDNLAYSAAQLSVQALWQGASSTPDGAANAAERWLVEQVAQIDSKDMDFAVWTALAQRCQQHLADPAIGGIVITHGTDTLEETAWFLHCVLAPDCAHKPLVLTCAMRPATALAPDGPQNLRDAATVATAPGACGVLVVCAGEIHGAREVFKAHPYRPNAFSSGDSGPLGWVEEKQVRLARNWPLAQSGRALAAIKIILNSALDMPWPRVDIVMSYAGASAGVVDALVASGAQGLVVAATGNGTLHYALQDALERAQATGVAVRIATRCPLGQMLARPAALLPSAQGLSPVKARVSLLLELLAL